MMEVEEYEITRDGAMTKDEARALTDEVKADASALWAKMLELYNRNAHKALGYPSWASYSAVEFEMGTRTSYRLLSAARVFDSLWNGKRSNGVVAGAISDRSDTGTPLPTKETVLRELLPVHKQDQTKVREVWNDAVAQHGPEPTAKQVRAVVQARVNPQPPPREVPAWATKMHALAATLETVASRPPSEEMIRDEAGYALRIIDDVKAKLEELAA